VVIHIGGREFLDIESCVAIVNLETVDPVTQKRVKDFISAPHEAPKTAILTTHGTWLTSIISAETLAQRGMAAPYPGAIYLRLNSGQAMDE